VTQIANDTFSDAHPTALTSHTSDSGHTWATTPGSVATFSIDLFTVSFGSQAGVAATSIGNTAEAVISRVPDAADYTGSIDVVVSSAAVWDFPGVILRSASGADTMYRALLTAGASGSGFVAVFTDKLVAGSESQIGTNSGEIAVTDADTLRLTFDVTGTALTINLLNVTSAASITPQVLSDSGISAIGQAGMIMQAQAGSPPHQVITAFSLSQTAGAPPVISPFLLRSVRVSPRRR
jgi:hypothetical protein